MPHLLVDLEDMADCQKGLQLLKRQLGRGGATRQAAGVGQAGERLATPGQVAAKGMQADGDIANLPLPQKLKRIQSRGMWKHLVKIARSAQEPSSLPELDNLLDLPKNKMRSLKAIMAKLENRFGVQFLKVDLDAGVDAAGNPRYVMLPNVRRQILRLADA